MGTPADLDMVMLTGLSCLLCFTMIDRTSFINTIFELCVTKTFLFQFFIEIFRYGIMF